MTSRLEVDGSGLEIVVAQQRLNGGKIGPVFHQMRSEAVAQQVWANAFGDARLFGRLLACFPHHLCGYGLVHAATFACAGEQVCLGPHPAPIFTKRIEQQRAQRDIPILAALALTNVDEHPLAVEVPPLSPCTIQRGAFLLNRPS